MGAVGPIILASIIILLIICIYIVAICIRRRRLAKNAELFSIQEALVRLKSDLDKIAWAADLIENYGRMPSNSIEKGDSDLAAKGWLILTKTHQGMLEIVSSIKRLRAAMEIKPHTYQRAFGLYKGLSDSDSTLLTTARTLNFVGKYIDTLTANTHENLKIAAANLQQMSSGLYNLTRSIHYLGSALQLE